jgi:hypothetical protein
MRPRSRIAGGLALAALALLAAASIYATARSGFRLHAWLEALHIRAPEVALPAFVRFNLPDALWQYAFTVCVLATWRTAARRSASWAFVALPLAIGGATELGQALGVMQGVYDPLDAFAMAIAAIAAVVTVGLPRSSPSRRAPGGPPPRHTRRNARLAGDPSVLVAAADRPC